MELLQGAYERILAKEAEETEMTTAFAKKTRACSRRSDRKTETRQGRIAGLPESAAFTVCGGRDFVLLPVDDLAEWLEDQLDYAESAAALKAERHKAIPLEQAIANLAGRVTRKAR